MFTLCMETIENEAYICIYYVSNGYVYLFVVIVVSYFVYCFIDRINEWNPLEVFAESCMYICIEAVKLRALFVLDWALMGRRCESAIKIRLLSGFLSLHKRAGVARREIGGFHTRGKVMR